jgi:adenylate cyclase
MRELDRTRVAAVVRWLSDGAPGSPRPEQVVQRLCDELMAAGLPLHRVAAFVRTPHPNVMGLRFTWRPGQPVDVLRAPHRVLDHPDYLDNPLKPVFETGQGLRRRLADPNCPRDFPILNELAEEGATDYVACPLRFVSGEIHVITWTTAAAGGFNGAEMQAIESAVVPLARISEIYALRRTAITLLNTYVGHDAGERILRGQIQRGDTATLAAAVWISDLRGFTAMSEELPPDTLVRVLNSVFDAQVPAILDRGGEVLKFLGDGLLAIFPATACAAALDAAEAALAAVAELDGDGIPAENRPLRIGIGLHVGEVSYGNVGSATRLDFTCIGPAINLAARLQALAAEHGWPLVLSQDFADRVARPNQLLGHYSLKGLSEPVPAFAPI